MRRKPTAAAKPKLPEAPVLKSPLWLPSLPRKICPQENRLYRLALVGRLGDVIAGRVGHAEPEQFPRANLPMIETASFSDLGYRRLEPGTTLTTGTIDRLLAYASRHANYEVQTEGDARWIRHRERKSGMLSPLIREVAIVDASTVDRKHALAALETIDRNWEGAGLPHGSLETCISLCCDASDEPAHRVMHFLTSAATLAPQTHLLHVISNVVLPAFFTRYPTGALVVFELDYAIERRFGFCRNLHVFNLHPPFAIDGEDTTPLHNLHAPTSLEQPQMVVKLLSGLTYPWITVVPAVRAGLLLAFVLDPPAEHSQGPFPESWSAKLRSGTDFAKERVKLKDLLCENGTQARHAAAHARHRLNHPPTTAQTLSLLRFTMQRYARTLWHITDPSEHCRPDSQVIQPLVPFEFGLTWDRVLRKGVLAVLGTAEIDRKDDCFELADLLEELWSRRNEKSGQARIFKRFFHRTEAVAMLKECVSGAPVSEWADIVPAVIATYDRLVDAVSASVVIRTRKSDAGVLVQNKALSGDVVEPFEEFTANLMRALRNAHHGYLTANDTSSRPARYLSLVSGTIPDDLSLVAAFWTWCTITAPETVFERQWLGSGPYLA